MAGIGDRQRNVAMDKRTLMVRSAELSRRSAELAAQSERILSKSRSDREAFKSKDVVVEGRRIAGDARRQPSGD
jgi:hypothetical protein